MLGKNFQKTLLFFCVASMSSACVSRTFHNGAKVKDSATSAPTAAACTPGDRYTVGTSSKPAKLSDNMGSEQDIRILISGESLVCVGEDEGQNVFADKDGNAGTTVSPEVLAFVAHGPAPLVAVPKNSLAERYPGPRLTKADATAAQLDVVEKLSSTLKKNYGGGFFKNGLTIERYTSDSGALVGVMTVKIASALEAVRGKAYPRAYHELNISFGAEEYEKRYTDSTVLSSAELAPLFAEVRKEFFDLPHTYGYVGIHEINLDGSALWIIVHPDSNEVLVLIHRIQST